MEAKTRAPTVLHLSVPIESFYPHGGQENLVAMVGHGKHDGGRAEEGRKSEEEEEGKVDVAAEEP